MNLLASWTCRVPILPIRGLSYNGFAPGQGPLLDDDALKSFLRIDVGDPMPLPGFNHDHILRKKIYRLALHA